MIGPGTGIAPFRGFIQKLAKEKKPSSSQRWLLFGCRRRDGDFLFRPEMETALEAALLTRFLTCFSREEERKEDEPRRVQDLIRANDADFLDVLEKSAESTLYVCGDANGMAKDVHECIVESYVKVLGIEEKEAREKLADLSLQGRYMQDVWT